MDHIATPAPGVLLSAGRYERIIAALRDAVDRSPAGLSRVLAGVIADGDPMRDMLPLFDAPDRGAPAGPGQVLTVGSVPAAVLLRPRRPAPAASLPLFET